MILNFFGNGSGFTDSHNNAWFIPAPPPQNMVLIDLSMLNLGKLLKMEPWKYEKTYLYVTHMHDDHTSGIGLFIQYMWYCHGREITIVAPAGLLDDIRTNLAGRDVVDGYSCMDSDKLAHSACWGGQSIPTVHTPGLDGKCFGYMFRIDGRVVVYSGDTAVLGPYLPYLRKADEFYLDISAGYGKVHLLLTDEVLDKLIKLSEHVSVYLMHIDDMTAVADIIKNTGIRIASVADM